MTVEHKEFVHDTRKPWEREMAHTPLAANADQIKVPGLKGAWYVVHTTISYGPFLLLLESEEDGDEAAHCIVDEYGYLVWNGCYNGWSDLTEALDDGTIKITKEEDLPGQPTKWAIHRDIRRKGPFS